MDVLYLRLIMITSNLILSFWAIYVLDYSLDGALYLATSTLINIIFAIPLIKERIPIEFKPEWEEIYQNIFSEVLSKHDFKYVKDLC
jgi:hypothetical protein